MWALFSSKEDIPKADVLTFDDNSNSFSLQPYTLKKISPLLFA